MGFVETMIKYSDSLIKVVVAFTVSCICYSLYNRKRMELSAIGKPMQYARKVLFRTLSVLPIAIMAGIRSYMTGADTFNLYKYFLATLEFSLTDWLVANSTSLLYDFFRWTCCWITNGNVQVFLFLLAFATLYLVVAAIDMWDLKYGGTALAIYYCLFGLILFDQTRQMLAVSIILYSFYYAYHHRPKEFILLVALAGLIHITAVVAGGAILFLVRVKNIKNKTVENVVYFAELIMICLMVPLGLSLIEVIFAGTKYEKYATATGDGTIGLGFFLAVLPSVVPALIMHKELDQENRFRDTILMVIPTRYAGYISTFLSRMNYFFAGMSVFAFPIALEKADEKRKRLYACILIGCYSVYFILWYCWKNADIYLPYMTFWEMPYVG